MITLWLILTAISTGLIGFFLFALVKAIVIGIYNGIKEGIKAPPYEPWKKDKK